MADVTDLQIAYIAAGAALLGSALGAVIPWGLQTFAEWLKNRKESRYLAILVIAHLDRFVMDCIAVAFDDGTEQGHPAGGSGLYKATASPPKFVPLELNLNWKVLPRGLMRDVLDIPRKLHLLASELMGIYEFDEPPDFSEYFWARREGYAKLGLAVLDVSRRLRRLADIEADDAKPEDSSEEKMLRDQIEDVRSKRDAYKWRMAEVQSRNGLI